MVFRINIEQENGSCIVNRRSILHEKNIRGYFSKVHLEYTNVEVI